MIRLEFCLVLACVGAVLSLTVNKPNFVMFLTDDQDVVLGGMEPMMNVQTLIANEGVLFTNSFVASPICCPSRASILTGLYPHNHGTINNTIAGGCNSASWRNFEDKTFAAVLKDVGYRTFYAGKYLNQYGVKAAGGPEVIPSGWTDWHGLVGNSVYYNYTISNNGVPSHEGNEYLTDVVCKHGLEFLSTWAEDRSQPFLMVLAPPAPHQPFTPAPRHKDVFTNVTVRKTPTFNITAPEKHWLMRMTPSPLPVSLLPALDDAFSSRWEALLAVDEMVARVMRRLGSLDQLRNTYVIYTSDNGYHIGQFSQVLDKRQPYETDIRVPLAIRGPGVPSKSLLHTPATNVDLAPTILKLAGIEAPHAMDGIALDLTGHFKERSVLVEYHGEGAGHTVDKRCVGKDDGTLAECSPTYACKCQDSRNNTYACVRHLHTNIDYKYCRFYDDEKMEEMYDLRLDPHELHNVAHAALPSLRLWYHLALDHLRQCHGRDCNTPPIA